MMIDGLISFSIAMVKILRTRNLKSLTMSFNKEAKSYGLTEFWKYYSEDHLIHFLHFTAKESVDEPRD